MTNSREKFEAIYGPMGFDLTRMYIAVPEPWSEYKDEKTGYAWAGWLAGRESMRDEVIDKLGDYEATKCAQIVGGIEL